MPELKLGNRHECSECGVKFYDLGKPTAICPKCGTQQEDNSDAPSRKRRKSPAVAKKKDADQLDKDDIDDDKDEEDKDDIDDDKDEEDEEKDVVDVKTPADFDLDDIEEDEDEDDETDED